MFKQFKRFVAASVAVAALALGAASPAAADPALWVVKDEDSTIYLFGTVHVLKPDTVWHTPAVDKALADSSELWIEVEADDPAVMQPLILKYGMDPANPLSKKLTPEQKARLDAAAMTVGVPPAALEPMRPWFAGLTLGLVQMMKAGYDPQSGVEAKLKAEAKTAGKPIRTLETPDQQIGFFGNLPSAIETEFLLSSLDEVDTAMTELDKLVAAWASGDTEALDALLSQEMKDKYPELHEVLLENRNKAWAESIDQILDGKGVIMIAVGAGHLVGEDSVQAQLAKRGIKAERLN